MPEMVGDLMFEQVWQPESKRFIRVARTDDRGRKVSLAAAIHLTAKEYGVSPEYVESVLHAQADAAILAQLNDEFNEARFGRKLFA